MIWNISFLCHNGLVTDYFAVRTVKFLNIGAPKIMVIVFKTELFGFKVQKCVQHMRMQ